MMDLIETLINILWGTFAMVVLWGIVAIFDHGITGQAIRHALTSIF